MAIRVPEYIIMLLSRFVIIYVNACTFLESVISELSDLASAVQDEHTLVLAV